MIGIKTKKNSPDSVDISRTKIILEQMMNSICKIKINENFGTGFFCEVPFFYDQKTLKVLMTNCHILDPIDYCRNKEINLVLNDDKEVKKINLGIDRKTYFNREFDIAIIEIKECDNIANFLELDENLFKYGEFYKDISTYILHYPMGNKAEVSYGKLIEINSYDIKHICNTMYGSSGSPILNLSNNKVIGIHKQSSDDVGKGTFLKFTLKNFYEIKKEGWKLKKFDDNVNINDSIKKNELAMKDLINDMKNMKKPGRPRMNILFKPAGAYSFNITASYGTTIDQLLKYYLRRMNIPELIATNKIKFLFDARGIVFGDETPIEIYFKNNLNPIIMVICFSNLFNWTKEENDIIKKEEDKIFSEINVVKPKSEQNLEYESEQSSDEASIDDNDKFNKHIDDNAKFNNQEKIK